MNINRVKRKLQFLIKNGYSYSLSGKEKLFCEMHFRKETFTITLQFDCHNEFLDLIIKENTKILVRTNYDSVAVDHLNWEKYNFSQLLKSVYTIPKNSYSLSQKQIDKLIDLYAGFLSLFK